MDQQDPYELGCTRQSAILALCQTWKQIVRHAVLGND